jgi:hypothetical protein
MHHILEQITNIFENVIMFGFFWYSLVLIVLKLTDSIKPKFFKIDRQICNVIFILGVVYIFAVLLECFAYHEAILMASGKFDTTNGFQPFFWLLVLYRPLLLFMFTQMLRVEKIANSMLFRGISAVLFLFIR